MATLVRPHLEGLESGQTSGGQSGFGDVHVLAVVTAADADGADNRTIDDQHQRGRGPLRYNGNCLVNAFAAGLADADKIFYSAASGVGMPVAAEL